MGITITHFKANPEMYVELDTDGIHYASNLESNFQGNFNLLMDCISANVEEGMINFDKGFQTYLDRILQKSYDAGYKDGYDWASGGRKALEGEGKSNESASDNSETTKIAN